MRIRLIHALMLVLVFVHGGTAQQPGPVHSQLTGFFGRLVFGELWRSAGGVSDSSQDHIEDRLRELLPPFVVDDLRAVRHPRGTAIAAELAQRAGVRLFGPEGLAESISTDSMAVRITDSFRDRVDATAFLRGRLFDLVTGDWSRSETDIRWIEDQGSGLWVPVAAPYRNPFVRFDGLIPEAILSASEAMTGFGPEYLPARQTTIRLRYLDRRLLAGVSRTLWDSTTIELHRRLDEVDLVDLTNGDTTLAGMLRSRIAHVSGVSEDLRRLVLRFALLTGTNESDSVQIAVLPGQRVSVSIHPRGSRSGPPALIFNAAATEEVRILLGDGHDIVTTEGNDPRMTVIVAAMHPPEIVEQRSAGSIRSSTARRPFTLHTDATAPHLSRKTDWGMSTQYEPWLDLDSDDGLFLGGGPITTRYGYALDPFAYQSSVLAGIATATGGVRVRMMHTTYEWWKNVAFRFEMNFAQADVTKFFGMGNETPAPAILIEQKMFDARRRELQFFAGIEFSLPQEWKVALSGGIRSSALTATFGSFIDSLLSHGFTRSLNFASTTLRVSRDTRSGTLFPVDGTLLFAELEVVPEFLQNRNLATHARIDARSYIGIADTSAVLVLRLAAEKVDGTVPWFESASIGGSRSLRGYERQRFRGDASIVLGAEGRIRVGRVAILWPQEFGLILLAESGRVFQRGEHSDRWHGSAGAGFWIRPLQARHLVSATLVRSSEDWKLSATLGFAF